MRIQVEDGVCCCLIQWFGNDGLRGDGGWKQYAEDEDEEECHGIFVLAG